MFTEILEEIQKKIDYNFKDISLLKQALTTSQLGKQLNVRDYNSLEILGDAVIKLILILKLYKKSDDEIRDQGEITKIKQQLENDATLSRIAKDYFNLDKYIFKAHKQIIEGTRILADAFEAICGAIFLDSGLNIKIVEEKIIDIFYNDLDKIIQETSILNKNELLEYIQKRHRVTPVIRVEFTNKGPDHAPSWIARNPTILDQQNNILVPLKKSINSKECKSKREAEQELYLKILKYLKKSNL